MSYVSSSREHLWNITNSCTNAHSIHSYLHPSTMEALVAAAAAATTAIAATAEALADADANATK